MTKKEPLYHTPAIDYYEEYDRPLIHSGKSNWELDSNDVTYLNVYYNKNQSK